MNETTNPETDVPSHVAAAQQALVAAKAYQEKCREDLKRANSMVTHAGHLVRLFEGGQMELPMALQTTPTQTEN
jgi:hypothetical protein